MAQDLEAGVGAEERAGSGGGEADFLGAEEDGEVGGGAFGGLPEEDDDDDDGCLGGMGGGSDGAAAVVVGTPSMTSHDGSADSVGSGSAPSSPLAADHRLPGGASEQDGDESGEDCGGVLGPSYLYSLAAMSDT